MKLKSSIGWVCNYIKLTKTEKNITSFINVLWLHIIHGNRHTVCQSVLRFPFCPHGPIFIVNCLKCVHDIGVMQNYQHVPVDALLCFRVGRVRSTRWKVTWAPVTCRSRYKSQVIITISFYRHLVTVATESFQQLLFNTAGQAGVLKLTYFSILKGLILTQQWCDGF